MDSAIDPLRLLRPPGRGILSFTTGARQNVDLEKRYFAKTLAKKSWPDWAKEILVKDAPFYLLGVPSDAGAGICRGSNHGPQFLREELYKKGRLYIESDLGDLPIVPQLSDDALLNPQQRNKSGKSLWGDVYREMFPVSPLNLLDTTLRLIWKQKPSARIFVMGGDHSISGAIFRALEATGKLNNLAVLHLDAHTDLLEERFGVENCFATWAAHSVKKLAHPGAWVQVGVRVSGRDKSYWEEKYGLRQLWAAEVMKKDPKKLSRELLAHWKKLGMEQLYVSLDVDALDPKVIPSTGTPEPKGLALEWTRALLKEILKELPLVSCDMVELAPILGSKIDARRSVVAAAKLAQTLIEPWKELGRDQRVTLSHSLPRSSHES